MYNELRSGLDDLNSAPWLDHEIERLRRLVGKSDFDHLTKLPSAFERRNHGSERQQMVDLRHPELSAPHKK